MLTDQDRRLIREFNLNCKRLFAAQEQAKKRMETWVPARMVQMVCDIPVLTLRRRKLVEWRIAGDRNFEDNLDSIPNNLKKQIT